MSGSSIMNWLGGCATCQLRSMPVQNALSPAAVSTTTLIEASIRSRAPHLLQLAGDLLVERVVAIDTVQGDATATGPSAS